MLDPMVWSVAQIILGLVLLVLGGEFLVRGACLLAVALQVSPLMIGLTVVAFGTSAPELGVSLQASLSDAADVALGNVVGSNICNVLLILGLSAAVAPLVVSSQLIRFEVPLMILASLLMWGFCLDLQISRWEGLVLFSLLVSYVVFSIRQSRKESAAAAQELASDLPKPKGLTSLRSVQIGLVIAGLVLLGFGSKWLVDGSVTIAKSLGISELIIGLTIVSVGTSLPELVTSVVASIRGERDIAVGNVVGSNLFNILCVLGICSMVSPSGIPVSGQALLFDIPVAVAVAFICLPVFFTGSLITRFNGAMLLFYYVAYIAMLVLAETSPIWKARLASLLAMVIIPLTLLAIAVDVFNSWRANRRSTVD